MPRKPRLNIEHGLYHVTQRGLEKRDIVADDHDRQEWLRLLHRQATQRGWRVFAYALLDNHFHLFVRTPQPNLSAGLQAFLSGYVTLFNKRHDRTGPLFQGRFGAVLVEYETHAKVLSRYVHMNPVEAGITQTPGAYAWSSYRYYLDPRGAPAWLDWQTILSEFSQREAAARVAYRRFVEADLSQPSVSPLDGVVDGWLLGSKAFVERYRDEPGVRHFEISEMAGVDPDLQTQPSVGQFRNSVVPDPSKLMAAVAQVFAVPIAQLTVRGRHRNRARLAAMWLCREHLQESLQEIGLRFGGLSVGTISDSLRQAEALMTEHAEYQQAIQAARELLH